MYLIVIIAGSYQLTRWLFTLVECIERRPTWRHV